MARHPALCELGDYMSWSARRHSMAAIRSSASYRPFHASSDRAKGAVFACVEDVVLVPRPPAIFTKTRPSPNDTIERRAAEIGSSGSRRKLPESIPDLVEAWLDSARPWQ